jgi:hypothetical protein
MVLHKYKLVTLFYVLVSILLSGCSASHTAINKRNLNVQTKMSSTIFLDPVAPKKKTILVQVRNTSDRPEFNIENQLKAAILSKEYTVVDDPKLAHYMLQVNILQVGKSDLRAAEHALSHGYGSALGGALAGAAVGSLASDHRDGLVMGGLIGAAVATFGDAMIQDISFSAITDIQISERAGKNVEVEEITKSRLRQGTSTKQKITSIESANWKRYQTRIISTANKANLKFAQAAPSLVDNLSMSIAGLF